MTPEDWRDEVGQHIERRRVELGIRSAREAARRSGFSEAVQRQLESGRRQLAPGHVIAPSPTRATQQALARTLNWPPNAIELLLQGEDPARLDRIAATAEVVGGTPRESLGRDGAPDSNFERRVVNEVEHLQAMVAWLEDAVEQLRDNDREDVFFGEKPVSLREHAANAMGGKVVPLKPRRPPVEDEDEDEEIPLAAESDLSPSEAGRAVKGARKRSKPTGADIEPADQ